MFDRGFIKWQPFNSVVPNQVLFTHATIPKKIIKPTLSNEQIEELNQQIIEAYYSQNKILITYYANNKIKKVETSIYKLNTFLNIIELSNHQKISFNQILNIKN